MDKINDIMLHKVVLPEATTKVNKSGGWLEFGTNNQMPTELIEIVQNASTHNAIVNGVAAMAFGQGLKAKNQSEQVIIDSFFGARQKEIRSYVKDAYLFGNAYLEVLKGSVGNIAKTNHLASDKVRAGVDDEMEIDGYWFSHDWTKKNPTGVNKPMPLNTFEEGGSNSVVAYHRQTTGVDIYGLPYYYAGVKYCKLESELAEFHLNNVANGFFGNVVFSFNDGEPDTDEEKFRIEKRIKEKFGGASGQRAFIIFNRDKEHGLEITPISIDNPSEQFQFISEEVDNKVLVAHRVTSPMLFGIRSNGGFGNNADELATSEALFMKHVVNPFRDEIIESIEPLLFAIGVKGGAEFSDNEEQEVQRDSSVTMKKKDVSDEELADVYERLKEFGEVNDNDEWELISEEKAGDLDSEKALLPLSMFESYAEADEKSKEDRGMYKLRYAYSDNISDKSRDFCVRMVQDSKAGVEYRLEDIDRMSKEGVNSQFAAKGQSTYDIFKFKGGAYCHHFWKRRIYFRKRNSQGQFLPNDGLNNDKRVGNNPNVRRKGEEGTPTNEMPNRGKLN